jgi:hypothetical protein
VGFSTAIMLSGTEIFIDDGQSRCDIFVQWQFYDRTQ